MHRHAGYAVFSIFALSAAAFHEARAEDVDAERGAKRLEAAYPDQILRVGVNQVVWHDGTRMPFDDGTGVKPFARWLENPDIEDTLSIAYQAGDLTGPPAVDTDPGRARNLPFFNKMYGDCRAGEVEKNLVDVVWLPKKAGQHLKVSRINNVHRRLIAISAELDKLPATFDPFLVPSAGTYKCRTIAGTDRLSAHSHGIAIDIATRKTNYWRWTKPDRKGVYAYRNAIPMEIVRIFERHGFIWGGKWYHYDTMHFEYRPELLPPAEMLGDVQETSDTP
jgi:D-alanyl-D-alanine carboxypeptidase